VACTIPRSWRYRRQPNEEKFVDCRANVEALWKQDDTGTMFSGSLESTEVSGHSADIVRDK
jgi:hypothetical protein